MIRQLLKSLPERQVIALKKILYKSQIRRGAFVSPEQEFELVKEYIRPGDVVLDIGANIGHYTLKFAELVGREGRVFAFEPIHATFSLLTENVAYAGFDSVTLINAAVSDRTAALSMSVQDNNYYTAAIVDDGDEKIFCFNLMDLCASLDIDFIKIDAEGQDKNILNASLPLIKRCKPVIMAELVPDDVADFLAEANYEVRRVAGSHNIIMTPR